MGDHDIPNFCKYCGAGLQWRKAQLGLFDEKTGRRPIVYKLVCPLKKWWQFFHHNPFYWSNTSTGYTEYTRVDFL